MTTPNLPDAREACCGGACRRQKPIRVLASGLSGRYYAVTRYRVLSDRTGAHLEAQEKHDVSADVAALIAAAEQRVRERVEAVLPKCYMFRETPSLTCLDLIGGEFRNGQKWSAAMCCDACKVRAALAAPTEEQP